MPDQTDTTQIAIFLSHSSIDDVLAGSLARLFQRAFRLQAGAIRCSSADGFRLPAGDLADAVLRREVVGAKAFVGLITPASSRSQYVLFEVGARWGSGCPLKPLLVGLSANSLSAPLANLVCLSGENEAQLKQLLDELARDLHVQLNPTELTTDLRVLAELARAKYLSPRAIREICRNWANDGDPRRGDLQFVPAAKDFDDDLLAFIGTTNYRAEAGIAMTPSGIVWRNPGDTTIHRIGWAELASKRILSNAEDDRITIAGTSLTIDLSSSSYDPGAVSELLRDIVALARGR